MVIWSMLPELWSVADIIFCNFGSFFALIPYYLPRKSNFGKNVKKPWTYYPFTHVYHNWKSCDVRFLRYKARQTEFLSFWATFCPSNFLTTQKIKILKEWIQHLEILSFHTCVPQMRIIWCMVPEIWSTTDRIFCHFGQFFALLPHL